MENESEYNKYLATLRKENDKSLYKKSTNNNINLDEVNKTLNDYISTHNKNFYFYFINYEIVIEFDNIFLANMQTNSFYKPDNININKYLLFDIDCFKSRGSKFYSINQMTINIISDR